MLRGCTRLSMQNFVAIDEDPSAELEKSKWLASAFRSSELRVRGQAQVCVVPTRPPSTGTGNSLYGVKFNCHLHDAMVPWHTAHVASCFISASASISAG